MPTLDLRPSTLPSPDSPNPDPRPTLNAPLECSTADDADRHRLAWSVWPADMTSPVRLFGDLRAAGFQPCLLESVEGPERLARYSFLGLDPVASFRGYRDRCTLTTEEGVEELAMPSHEGLREVSRRTPAPAPPRGFPPLAGGWIGWFAYEWATTLEPRVPRAKEDPWGVPDATFELYRTMVALDHAAHRLYIIQRIPEGRAEFEGAQARIDEIATALQGQAPQSGAFELVDAEAKACMERGQYEGGVRRLQGEIREGEIFQAVLSQRFEQRFEGDPFTLYRVLRLTNPSPHMFFFEADGLSLVGSSPERLVSCQGRRAQIVPIAGTRPRGGDEERDVALAAELRGDPKERAEHDMLVDLGRNDLGRVARIGTVSVQEHATLEKFAHVQHLVSRVECDLASGHDAIDLLVACFPAGTVSGAPKVRAMELLAEVEPTTRGPYAGAFGYLDDAGNLDMCIAIRTLAVRDSTVHCQAGAGVVHDSNPAKEFEETLHKSGALFEALRLADSPAFRPLENSATRNSEAQR